MIYYFFHVLGFVGVTAYVLLRCRNYAIPKGKGVILTVLAYVSMYAWMLILKILVTGETGQNIVRAFVFLPLFTWLYGNALGLKKEDAMDLVAPAPCLVQAISHIGCLFPGCCRSWLEVSWGIYNPVTETKLFPVQIAESLTALVIFILLVVLQGKPNTKWRGLLMPLMLVLFGVTRFGWEFLRDNEKLFLFVSELALWAMGMALVGAVWIIIKRSQNKAKTKITKNG